MSHAALTDRGCHLAIQFLSVMEAFLLSSMINLRIKIRGYVGEKYIVELLHGV